MTVTIGCPASEAATGFSRVFMNLEILFGIPSCRSDDGGLGNSALGRGF